MAKEAPAVCENADPASSVRGSAPSPDLLLVLLEVARSGRYTAAAATLGIDHTTVARRIAALEKAAGGRVLARSAGGWALTPLGERLAVVGQQVADVLRGVGPDGAVVDAVAGTVRVTATDGFSAYIASPAVAALRREHPDLSVEIVTATRQAAPTRSGTDIEVVVAVPQVHRAQVVPLGEYELGMYAAPGYLAEHGTPTSIDDLAGHGLVYFADSMLQVDELDAPRRLVPGMVDALTSTNVFVHVEATRAGAGVGFLPCFMADRHDDLVRVLPDLVAERLVYWMVVRREGLRQPTVAAVVGALREAVATMAPVLLPSTRGPAGT
ncbi:LysR family transcriptional regulator [Lapillicoccus jejuensis]|uniref:DNA-binding transcriptional LysR family regulator n=1 Tax=Lapillicoccus jejuensis TaxID=402171 RepID=A0A542E1N4_9MICO|nr:LysR family transcriptional regulator [Lapillicoccus jejuensis]TQJ09246.1 DNA-binding transcriptional LysR family regulator [Lapillicoccus jejuensis]